MKKIYKILIPVVIILCSIIWGLSNNSFNISSDELWYTDYGISFNDQETDDIRHTTEDDLHQIAFLKGYRIIQRCFVKTFGLNIYGLRAINLFFLILTLLAIGWLCYKVHIKPLLYVLFPIFLFSNLKLLRMLYSARPDWIIICLAIITLSFAIYSIYTNKKKLMYLSIVTASLSTIVYWNGLAIVAGLGALLLFVGIKKIISWKQFFKFFIFFFISLLLTLGLDLISEKEMVYSLSHSEVLHTARISEGFILKEYPVYLFRILNKNFLNGKQALMFSLLTFITIFLTFINLRKKELKETNNILLLFPAFFVGYTLIAAFRGPGSGSRAIFMISPVIMLWFIFALNFYLNNLKNKKILNIIILSYLAIFIGLHSFYSVKHILSNQNQWQEYSKLSKDLQEIIPNDGKRVYTEYVYAWALKDYPKFFQENNYFKAPQTIEETKDLLNTYNINYIMIDELNRFYAQNPEYVSEKFGDDIYWYSHLMQIAEKDFVKIGEVYNKNYYFKKYSEFFEKELIPEKNNKGFRIDIYARK